MQRAFDLLASNKGKPKNEQLTYKDIATIVQIPYTTVCERLSGRRGHGTGKCAGGKRQPRVLTEGKQAGLKMVKL